MELIAVKLYNSGDTIHTVKFYKDGGGGHVKADPEIKSFEYTRWVQQNLNMMRGVAMA